VNEGDRDGGEKKVGEIHKVGNANVFEVNDWFKVNFLKGRG